MFMHAQMQKQDTSKIQSEPEYSSACKNQCFERKGETKDERAKRKNKDSLIQKRKRENFDENIPFRNTATVTQPFFGQSQLKKKKREESESCSHV